LRILAGKEKSRLIPEKHPINRFQSPNFARLTGDNFSLEKLDLSFLSRKRSPNPKHSRALEIVDRGEGIAKTLGFIKWELGIFSRGIGTLSYEIVNGSHAL
jgi:hypothetical protein